VKKKASVQKNGAWDARRIRSLRLSFGDTQESFAHRLRVSFVSVNRWENGGVLSRFAQQRLDEIAAGAAGAKKEARR